MNLSSRVCLQIKCSEKQTELEGEVFEVLSTITDFLAFKEMFLDYRAVNTRLFDTFFMSFMYI